MSVQKFKRVEPVVEAVQFTGSNLREVMGFLNQYHYPQEAFTRFPLDGKDMLEFRYGPAFNDDAHRAQRGDWLVFDETESPLPLWHDGEHFARNYEPLPNKGGRPAGSKAKTKRLTEGK